MAKRSAGILLFRRREGGPEVLLVHPGGPFWAKKDLGAWSIPKGEHEEGEDGQACALREFEEEIGVTAGGRRARGPRQREASAAGKIVQAWALRGGRRRGRRAVEHVHDGVAAALGSGARVPRGGPRGVVRRSREARERINPAQSAFLDRLAERCES